MRTRLRGQFLAVGVGLLVASCATNQRLRVDATTPQPVRGTTLPESRAYAQATRANYQKMLDAELGAERNLGTALIGFGSLIAGLATFGAHRDAVAAAALLGGTAWAMGNWNINRQRPQVYLAGIKALNCAIDAVAPFDMPEAKRLKLDEGLAKLEVQRAVVTSAMNRVTTLQTSVPRDTFKDVNDAADQALADARATTTAARELQVTGQKISANVLFAGGALDGAVGRIDYEVDNALKDTYPSLSTITNVVADLAPLAGSLAPGSLVQGRIADALKGSGGPKPQAKTKLKTPADGDSSPSGRLALAVAELSTTTESLRDQVASVRAVTIAFDSAATSAALSGCGVTVSFALSVQPTEINLAAGDEFPVIVEGGTAGYRAQVQGSGTKGFEIVQPLGKERVIRIRGTAELKGPKAISVLVTDSSEPFKTASIAVTVAAASPETPSTPPADNPLATRIDKVAAFAFDAATTLSVEPPSTVANGVVQVTLVCSAPPATPISQADALAKLVKQVVDGSALEADVTASGKTAGELIKVLGAADCIAPAPQSRVRLKKNATAKTAAPVSAELKAAQPRLCLPAFLADGKWGPTTAKAAKAWREKVKRDPHDGPLTDDELRTIREATPAVAAGWCPK